MILVFAETAKGNFKKAAFEAVTYGKKVAANYGTDCAVITIGTVNNAAQLGQYGAAKIYNVAGNDAFDAQVYAAIIADAAKQIGAKVVVTSHTSTGKSLAGRIAVRLSAGLVSGANSVLTANGSVTKSVFSGKALAEYSLTSDVKVISVMGNAIAPEKTGSDVAMTPLSIAAPASRVKVKSVKTADGIVPLPEAEKVVSAGRGMKDPANWGIVEELATALGATTACSRPVADAHWRPHHEHVGQTGVAIRPNLYIAIGISGAIQHLAGVNNSRTIVVINKDPEAPFFKAADYGVVGDLFDVVPRLTEAIKKYKASQN
jgi:electron transfer flavoprotein alpha subunit